MQEDFTKNQIKKFEERKKKIKYLIRDLLKSTGYLSVNKKLVRKLGLYEAILVADLISKEEYFENKNELNKEGYFYNVQENIQKDTQLSAFQQREAIKNLKEARVISVKKIGMPAKYYFKINYEKLEELLSTSD